MKWVCIAFDVVPALTNVSVRQRSIFCPNSSSEKLGWFIFVAILRWCIHLSLLNRGNDAEMNEFRLIKQANCKIFFHSVRNINSRRKHTAGYLSVRVQHCQLQKNVINVCHSHIRSNSPQHSFRINWTYFRLQTYFKGISVFYGENSGRETWQRSFQCSCHFAIQLLSTH